MMQFRKGYLFSTQTAQYEVVLHIVTFNSKCFLTSEVYSEKCEGASK